jgi:hypothetical protein
MSNRSFALRKRFGAVICAGLAVLMCGVFIKASGAQISPLVFSTSTVDVNGHPRAIALESVTLRAEPFSLSSESNFSPALNPEYVGTVPGFDDVYMVVLRLNQLAGLNRMTIT